MRVIGIVHRTPHAYSHVYAAYLATDLHLRGGCYTWEWGVTPTVDLCTTLLWRSPAATITRMRVAPFVPQTPPVKEHVCV